MYEKTNSIFLTMQRYGEKMAYGNPFNESTYFFSKKLCCLKKKMYFCRNYTNS